MVAIATTRADKSESAQGAEEGADVLGQQCRLFHRSKVSALLVFVPVRHLVLRVHESPHDRLCIEHHPTARHAGRRNPIKIGVLRLGQETRRTGTATGEPVETDVRQQLITIDCLVRSLRSRVRPGLELLNNPGELADRESVRAAPIVSGR